jgi:hypothetical protein
MAKNHRLYTITFHFLSDNPDWSSENHLLGPNLPMMTTDANMNIPNNEPIRNIPPIVNDTKSQKERESSVLDGGADRKDWNWVNERI